MTSSLTGISSTSEAYDADDRLTTDTYDPNGNTLASGSNTYAYDFLNRLTSVNSGATTMTYDGDGNRVAKGSTQYLVSEVNPTGLPQVVDEIVSGAVQRTYTYGLARISETQLVSGTWTPSFYGYDGHSDVRLLTNTSGAVTDTYEYDSYGNLVGSTGSTANVYFYQGEQFDTETGLYYLRARYYNPATGRFLNVDPAMSPDDDIGSAHPYQYAGADPPNQTDPSGEDFESVLSTSVILGAATAFVPFAPLHNNFVDGTFGAVPFAFVCIMSEVASDLRNSAGLYNYGDCVNNAFYRSSPGGTGGPRGPGGRPGPGGLPPRTPTRKSRRNCPNGYQDADRQAILADAEGYLGEAYMDVGQCTGLVTTAIQDAVDPNFLNGAPNGNVDALLADPDLRELTGGEQPMPGDVVAWPGHHIGFVVSTPPSSPLANFLSALGSPKHPKTVAYANGPTVQWFLKHDGQPTYYRVQVCK